MNNDDPQLLLPTFSETFQRNPGAIIFTAAFLIIFFGTVFYYLTVKYRARKRRRPLQSVHDAIDYSKRVKLFFELLKNADAEKPPLPYKPLVGGLPPRRDEHPPGAPTAAPTAEPVPPKT